LTYKEFAPTQLGLDEIYSSAYVHFQAGKPNSDPADINSARQKLARCRKLLQERRPPGELRLLDVGCATGRFVSIANGLGYQADGIDPYLPDDLEDGTLRKLAPEQVAESSYDIAVLLNVMEHLDEPRPMLQSIHRLLKPGGVLLLTCPYGESLARRFYRDRWIHLALDEHLLFWTPRALTTVLREIGFKGDFSVRIAGSPFPFGRLQASTTDSLPDSEQAECKAPRDPAPPSFQSRVWQVARKIQRKETTANFVRSMVHFTRTGDYLEYAIRVDK